MTGRRKEQGIGSHDIYYVEPDQFGPHALRVNRTYTKCVVLNETDFILIRDLQTWLLPLYSKHTNGIFPTTVFLYVDTGIMTWD